MTSGGDRRFSCCFCGKTIADDQAAIALTGVNLDDWKNDDPEPRAQTFWSHFTCLTSSWSGTYPWEADAIFGDMD